MGKAAPAYAMKVYMVKRGAAPFINLALDIG
jgi:hypothetical protein